MSTRLLGLFAYERTNGSANKLMRGRGRVPGKGVGRVGCGMVVGSAISEGG